MNLSSSHWYKNVLFQCSVYFVPVSQNTLFIMCALTHQFLSVLGELFERISWFLLALTTSPEG